MKKLLVLLFILGFVTTTIANSQTFIENPSRSKKGNIEESDVHWESQILNNALSPVTYRIKIDTSGLNPEHLFYFCWDNCYGPGQESSYPEGQKIDPNSAFLFSLHIVGPVDESFNYSKLKEGNSQLCATFYNVNQPNDTFNFCIDYQIGLVTSVNESKEQYVSVLPNPSSNSTNVQYQFPSTVNNAMFTLYNITGSKVLELPLAQQGNATINTSALEQGAYYFAISNNGTIVQRSILQVLR